MNALEEVATGTGSGNRQLVTFRVRSQCYAVPIETVVEMTLLRDLDPIVGAPPWILGMMQLRDTVIPIFDLRSRLGLTELQDEIRELESELQAQKQDHVVWLMTLEECCREGTRFELARDASQCAFDHWLHTFKTEDSILASQIAKFGEPHDRIHALADRCLELAAAGNQEAAQNAITSARDVDLCELTDLFDHAVREVRKRSRQMVVILRGDEENLGLAVDRVESVATVDSMHVDPRPLRELESSGADFLSKKELLVTSVVRSQGDGGLIQVLDVDRVFASAGVSYSGLDEEVKASGESDHG